MPPAYFTPRRRRGRSFTTMDDDVRRDLEMAVSAGAHLIAETGARAGFAPMLDVCRAEFCARAGIDDPNPGRAAS